MTKLGADSGANNSDVHNVSCNVTPTFSGTSGGYIAHFQTIKNFECFLGILSIIRNLLRVKTIVMQYLYSKLLNVLHVTLWYFQDAKLLNINTTSCIMKFWQRWQLNKAERLSCITIELFELNINGKYVMVAWDRFCQAYNRRTL